MNDILLRPLTAADVPAAQLLGFDTFADLDRRTGEPAQELTADLVERGESRVAHLVATDPDGSWAAELDGRLVGVALSMRRDQVWFLSLLVVAPGEQGKGLGRRLLEQAMTTADLERGAYLTASTDPLALRRYQRAGFALLPAFSAKGVVDRARLPAVQGVRTGSLQDADLADAVATAQRGAPMTPEWVYAHAHGVRSFVTDGPAGRGFALLRRSSVIAVAASTDDAARRLLWTALAEADGDAEVEWLTGQQQWALDVVLDARLGLRPAGPVCRQGALGPMTPYLPSGAFG